MITCGFLLALSLHVGIGDGWNGVHPGAKCESEPWTVGAYYNSERAVSVFGSYTLETGPWFAEFGVVTGYSGFKPPAVPFARFGVENDRVKYFISPALASIVHTNEYGVTTVKTLHGAVFGMEVSF